MCSATDYSSACNPGNAPVELPSPARFWFFPEREGGNLIPGGVTAMPTPFKLLGLSLSSQPLSNEMDAPATAVAGQVLFFHSHVSFLVCRHGFGIE